MQHIWSILIALLIFELIIVIHEFGHFIVAKLHGIRVNQFAIGMGPKLLHIKRGETEYSLRLFPVGGFCQMEGEEDSSADPRSYSAKSVWRRMTVILAGAFMNLVLGFVLLVTLLGMGDKIPTTTIAEFAQKEDSVSGEMLTAAESQRTGLQVGDKIIAMDGSHIFSATDLVYKLRTTETDSFSVTVRRDGKKVVLENVSFHNDNTDGLLDFAVVGKSKNPVNLLVYGLKDTAATAKLIWMSMVELITGKYGIQDLSGPIGTISVIEEAATANADSSIKERIETICNLTAFITINVGVFNLLPIPALDGSKFIFLLIEAIRKKPISKEREAIVHLIGMALLFLLMIFATVQDIGRLFQ